jgi:hypothetical protein
MSGAAAAQVFTQKRMRRAAGLMERMFIDDAIKLLSIIKDPYEPASDYTSCYVTHEVLGPEEAGHGDVFVDGLPMDSDAAFDRIPWVTLKSPTNAGRFLPTRR